MIKLSIVIPVYNVEKYIGKCLDSCIDQDLSSDEFEILVVNDETPDQSLEIVKDRMSSYPNIRLINRRNGGLSAARNTGLDHVQGEYVWFVDSDDWIEADCIGALYHKAKSHNLDVLCFGLNLAYPDGKIIKFSHEYKENEKVFDGQEFVVSVNTPPAVWACIYRTDYLRQNNLQFLEGILHEDQEFTPRAYSLARRISCLDRQVYFYNQREGSIMKSCRNVKRCRDLLTVADSLYSFTIKHFEAEIPVYKVMMQKIYFCVTQSLAFYSRDAFTLSEYRRRPYYPMDGSICVPGLKRKIMLANLSLRLYTIVYKLLKK